MSAPPQSSDRDAPATAGVAPRTDAEVPSIAIASVNASGDGDRAASPAFVTASHAELFTPEPTDLCDVCGEPVPEDAEDGYAVAGRGLYVWSRGEDVRYEEPPLCPACAAALGVSALARWEIEEEEG